MSKISRILIAQTTENKALQNFLDPGSCVGVEVGPNGTGGGFWIVKWDHDPAFLAIWDIKFKSWETLLCRLQKRSRTWKLEGGSAWKVPIGCEKTMKSNAPILQIRQRARREVTGRRANTYSQKRLAQCLPHPDGERISWKTRESPKRYPFLLIQRTRRCL